MKLLILAAVYSILNFNGLVSGQVYNEYACLYDNLALQCPNPKTIYIERADYGQYFTPCDSGCCPPTNQDCKADVQQSFPDDMKTLRDTCDNKTSCSIPILGQSLPNCTGVRQVQYAHVFFRCYPEDPTTEPPTTQSTTQSTPSIPPSTSSTPPPTDPPGDDGLGAGVIVGIVFGVLILVACGILVGVIIYKKLNAPPPGKRKKKPNQRLRMQYDNNGYVHENQIQLSVINSGKENGIPVQTRPKVDPKPPVSDGKRSSKPVSAAESFRYAKEKEDVIAKYRNQKHNAPDTAKSENTSSSVINETNSEMPKAKKRSKKKSGGSKKDLSVKTEKEYEEISNTVDSPNNEAEHEYANVNNYENVHTISDDNKRSS